MATSSSSDILQALLPFSFFAKEQVLLHSFSLKLLILVYGGFKQENPYVFKGLFLLESMSKAL